jgi:hypothetical protein
MVGGTSARAGAVERDDQLAFTRAGLQIDDLRHAKVHQLLCSHLMQRCSATITGGDAHKTRFVNWVRVHVFHPGFAVTRSTARANFCRCWSLLGDDIKPVQHFRGRLFGSGIVALGRPVFPVAAVAMIALDGEKWSGTGVMWSARR